MGQGEKALAPQEGGEKNQYPKCDTSQNGESYNGNGKAKGETVNDRPALRNRPMRNPPS